MIVIAVLVHDVLTKTKKKKKKKQRVVAFSFSLLIIIIITFFYEQLFFFSKMGKGTDKLYVSLTTCSTPIAFDLFVFAF